MSDSESAQQTEDPMVSNRSTRGFWAAMAVCLIVIGLWFSPWWLGGRNLAPLDLMNEMMQPWRGESGPVDVKNHMVADAVDQYLVYRMIAAESYRSDGWVGWSSLTYGGTAQFANTMALYFDWTMQLHRWFDFWTAWHLGLMGQVALAALGMMLFCRGRGAGWFWASCGGLAYAANSQFVTWLYHRWALGAFCWVPWILLAIDWYRSGKRWAWGWVPVFLALAFLGGTLQHGVLVVLAVLAMWADEAFRMGKCGRQQAGLLGRYMAWGGIGCGMAAMMWLPSVDALLVSQRFGLHPTAAFGVYPRGWLQPLMNALSYPLQIFPSLFGRSESLDLLKLFKSELFYVVYFGSLPMLIGYLAFFKFRSPRLVQWLIWAGLILPLTPLVRALYQRLFLLFVLGGIVAFVEFMQHAPARTKTQVARVGLGVLALVSILWGLASIGFAWQAEAIENLLRQRVVVDSVGSSFGLFREWMAGRLAKFVGDLCVWSPHQFWPLVLAFCGLLGLWLSQNPVLGRRRCGAVLVWLVVVLELTLFASRWLVFVDPAKHPLFPVTPEVTALKNVLEGGRVKTVIKEEVGHMAKTPFVPNTLAAYGIPTINGYDSIVPDGMALPSDNSSDATRLGRLAISHLVATPGFLPQSAGWSKIWQNHSMVIFQNQWAVPRVIGFPDRNAFAAFMHSSAPATSEQTWRPIPVAWPRENDRILHVPAGVSVVRVAENQASGWEFRVADGPWQAIGRAADASMVMDVSDRGVPLEQPTPLTMRYRPPLLRIGWCVSGFSLLLGLAGAVIVTRRPTTLLTTAP